MSTNYPGIDYGLGKSNVDTNGIRYGVISQNSVVPESFDVVEYDYGPPHCPKCNRQASKPEEFGETFEGGRPDDYTHNQHECDDYVCVECKHFFGSESAFGDEPCGWSYEEEGYALRDCLNNDMFVIKSPFYTHAQYCSPCVPGAGNLNSPFDGPVEGWADAAKEAGFPKVYCLGHDWFDDSVAPYPVFSVETNEQVMP